MRYTIKDKAGPRPATPAERAYIDRLLKLHMKYWMWFTIRAVAFIVAIYLLAHMK